VEKNCIKLSDANWKSDISDAVKNSHEVTCTEWCLTRLMKLQTSYSLVFPALVHIAEVCLSMPVSNAWPEHGCSAPKSVKTRLRSRLSVEMLQTLLAITINGPNLDTPECESLMTSAVDLWESQKKRRKFPRDRGAHITVASGQGAKHPVPTASTSIAADVAIQIDGLKPENPNDVTNLASSVVDKVAVATTALNLDADSSFDEGIYSDSEDVMHGANTIVLNGIVKLINVISFC